MPDSEGEGGREGGGGGETQSTEGIRRKVGKLTLHRAETPELVFAVVVGRSTPEVTVLTAGARAVVEPLAVVHEGEIAGVPVRVALDGVDVWEAHREKVFMAEERKVCFVRKLWL